MPSYKITAPDGNTYTVTAPEGATQDQVLQYAQANYQHPSVKSGAVLEHTQPADVIDPTEGMSGYDKFMAGMGKSAVDTWRGLEQVVSAAADAIPGVDLTDYRKGLQSEIDDSKATDAPLMKTGAGIAGNIAGTAAQLIGPGVLARGTLAASALLPSTIIGNAAQGAAMGALSPTSTGESRTMNALSGAVGGGVASGAAKGIGALARLALPSVSTTDRNALGILMREADNPNSLQTVAPSQVPGVQRTLAEETLDPGIARLERNVRSTSNGFSSLDSSNNAARVKAIEGFAGDDAALSSAKQSRTQQTQQLLAQANNDTGVNVGAVRSALDKQIEDTKTRPSVQSALLDVKNSLDKAGDDVFSLYGTRKYIDDLLSGKAGGDKSYAKSATRELMQVKSQLDNELANASPSFAQYLNQYRQASIPINRMQIGQELLKPSSGSAILDPVTGNQVLTPAQFSKKSRSLDDIAAKATGFKKANAASILQPSDIATIKAIQDDLERQAFRATAGSGGNSQTFERAALQDRIAGGVGRKIAGNIPVVGPYVNGLLDVLDKTRNDRIKERLAYLIANPSEARRVISALPPSGQNVVIKALNDGVNAAGRASGIAASDQSQNHDQQLNVDIVGGTPVPADQYGLSAQQ